MTNDKGGGDLTPTPPSGPPPERLSDILPSVLPLAQQYLDNQRHELALRERSLDRESRLEEKEIGVASQQWRWQVIFLAGVCLALLAISGGLIFYLREVNAGLLVLSHLAALATGAFGGAGWARWRTGGEQDDGNTV
jgi:hypothetical protein